MNLKQIFIAADIFPPEIGGQATYTARLSHALVDLGFEIRILCLSSHKIKKMEKFKVYKVSRRWPMIVRYFLYFLKLFFLSYNFPVIYAQGVISSGLPALLVKKLLDKKLALKFSGDYAWEQAQIYKRTTQDINEWQKKPVFKTRLPKAIGKITVLLWVQKIVAKSANKVIVPSHYLKQIALGWGVENDKIEVIYNAVSLKPSVLNQQNAKKEIGISGDILLTVGRFMPWKGFDFLIKLMPEILNINPNFKLVIVGDGQEFRKCQSIIQEFGLLEKVFLTGGLNKDRLAVFFRASFAFLLNSGYEGMSYATFEAMKSGLPVLVSDIGANPEIVDDEISGMLIRYNDKNSWLDAIKKVWQDEGLRKRLSNTQLPKLPCFNFEQMIERTVNVLVVD